MKAIRRVLPIACVFVLAVAGCATEQGAAPTNDQAAVQKPPFRVVVPMVDLMGHVIEPAAEGIWDAVVTTVTAEKVDEKFPRTDDEWLAVENAAVTLTESGNLLMMEGRARDGDWMKFTQDMMDAGAQVMKAVEARNVQALLDSGAQVYNTCLECHTRYPPP